MLISGAAAFAVLIVVWAGLVFAAGKSIKHSMRDGWPPLARVSFMTDGAQTVVYKRV